MTYPFGTAEGNAQMDFQRASLGGVRANVNGISSPRNGPTISQSVSSSAVGPQSISLQNVVRRVFEPQFRNLQDLEQTVDKQQAESLRLLRISQRERHKAVSAPVEYFYRSILIPKLAWSILLQFIYAVVLLGIWTPVAKFIDVFYIHTHLRTQNTFFEDFKSLFSLHTVINWRNCLGAVLLAGAATWHYVQFVGIPPPVFLRKEEKLKTVIKMMVLSGPWILVYFALMCLRPDLPLAVEKLIEHDATTAVEIELLEASTGTAIAHLSEIFVWDILLRVLAPFIFLSALILAVEIVKFWKGEYSIGALRPGSGSVPWWKRLVGNPLSTINALRGSVVSFSKERLRSVISLPGPPFVIILSSLFFLPILFPVGVLFRIWIYYHCLAFVIVRVWQFGLDVTKQSLAVAHSFFSLNFFDIVALPPVLKDLRRMNWTWLPYFELQTVNGIHECFRFQPSILKEFLTVKLSTRDLNQLASFMQFWITPLREFASHLRKMNSLPSTAHNGAGPFMNVIWGAMSYLMKVAAVYDYRIHDRFTEHYDGALKASCVKSSLFCIDDVRVLSELLVSGNVVDEKSILAQYYDSTVEVLTSVAVAFRIAEGYCQGATVNDFLNNPVELEPGVRFYLKSFSQLQTIVPLHLRELLQLIDARSYDLRISDPDCGIYIEQLRRETLS